MTLTVRNPVAARALTPQPTAARPVGLDGRTLGLWWNQKFGGDVALERIGARLGVRFDMPLHREFSPFPAPKGTVASMADNASVVVGTTADCGSCTSWLIHDLVALERQGVPTVAIVSRGFEDDARASALAFGMPDLPFVVVPHTLTSSSPEAITAMVDAVMDDFVAALTTTTERSGDDTGIDVAESESFRYETGDVWADFDAFQEDFLLREWGDGFPLIPPTEDRVRAMLGGTSHRPGEVICVLPPGMTEASVEKIAVNAVMAGCRPEHLPILLAAVEAMNEPEFLLRTMACSTGPHSPLLIINGPVAERLGINSAGCALGPGAVSRANTVIGRAVRLILMNVGHAYPGRLDLDTIGAPRKYGMCLAENEAASPWSALHVEHGFNASESAVTVFGVESEIEVMDFNNFVAERLLMTFAGTAVVTGPSSTFSTFRNTGKRLDNMLLVAPDHAQIAASGGFDKDGVREFLFAHARREWKWLANSQGDDRSHLREQWAEISADPDAIVPVVADPAQFHLCVVGGAAGKSQYLTGVGQPVTKSVDRWM